MSSENMPWDEAALERLERIPRFVRAMAKDKIEKAAQAAGESRVTVAFMDANKAKLMG
jgi:Proto-chlorophyllide reductase 57 kD subunit